MENAIFQNPHFSQHVNPDASVVHGEALTIGHLFTLTVRDDAGNVLHITRDPHDAADWMRANDPAGWNLSCWTECGRPVSLLNCAHTGR